MYVTYRISLANPEPSCPRPPVIRMRGWFGSAGGTDSLYDLTPAAAKINEGRVVRNLLDRVEIDMVPATGEERKRMRLYKNRIEERTHPYHAHVIGEPRPNARDRVIRRHKRARNGT